MAILKTEDKQVKIADGVAVKDAARELGINFSCEVGMCGTCCSHVLEGMENLEDPNETEDLMSMNKGEQRGKRLMCQAKIKSGEVKIKQGNYYDDPL
jgi:ferredoxin